MGMRGTDSSTEFSENMASIVDAEVANLIHTAHQEAFDVLEENRDVLDALVRELFERETLNKQEVAEVFKPLRRRDKRPAWTGSDDRIPSELPPVDVPTSPSLPAEDGAPQLPPSAGPGFAEPQQEASEPGQWAPPTYQSGL